MKINITKKRREYYMKNLKTILLLLMMTVVFVGCQEVEKDETSHAQPTSLEVNQDKGEISNEFSQDSASEKVIVDQMGQEVVIAGSVDQVVMSALPLPSIYALTNEPIDKIVGMHPGSKSAIENSIMGKMYPDLLGVSTGFVEGTDINIEELLKLNPSIVFYWGPYSNQTEQLNNAGIPAIGVKTQGDGDALLTLSTWLKIMGDVFDKEAQVKTVIDYGESTLDEITSEIKDIPTEERVKSMFLFKHSSEEIVVPGTGHYGNYWIEKMGGHNVARAIDVTANVNMEQVYEWNPEKIFISSFTTTTPEDLYENRIEGQDWSSVEAVRNKEVYKVPVGVYRWYPPSGDVPLMMKWMAMAQYPERFNYDMKTEIISYYHTYYQYELSDEEACGILNPVSETADGTAGFGKQK
jgi:iron complex transport system substrate-binding protein